METYYLAYGSNLNIEVMRKRCPSAIAIGTLILDGYKLAFKGEFDNYSYLTILKDKNSSLPLGVYLIDSSDIKRLDMYEGYPTLYDKKYFDILVDGEEYNALIYVMRDNYSYHLPSIDYLKTCIDGYHDFNFNNNYLIDAYINTKINKVKEYEKRHFN